MSTQKDPRGLSRFAPAPTGYLHLGHVASAIYVWGLARARGARVLLRIEDHDRQRSRPAYEQALLDDLDWLGFEPDVFRTDEFRAGPSNGRQSDRHAHYEVAAKSLAAVGLLYGCTCSRQDLTASAPADDDGGHLYPGTCRDKGIGLESAVAWRVRLGAGIESFTDLLAGPQAQHPAEQCGDLVIRDRLGNWTYQFVVSVDDFLQGIDLVIRGQDLLASTGRQMRLSRMLGRVEPPVFAHHGLIMQSSGRKLSKSDHDTGIRDLRESGWTAARVIGEAARRVGLRPGAGELPASAVGSLFA